MADNELSSASFANSASRADSPQIKAQKDTGKELKIKPPGNKYPICSTDY